MDKFSKARLGNMTFLAAKKGSVGNMTIFSV